VRRDIAARNILVFRYDPDDVTKTSVKLSDFGLTVNACTATHMYVSEGPKPVRYLAPEALQKRRYSEKSDVWSFGVMGWELLTNGNLPYYDITSDDNVVRHVVGGGALPAPDDAAVAPIWVMLQRCFAKNPADRPTFAELGIALGSCPPLAGPSRSITIRIEHSRGQDYFEPFELSVDKNCSIDELRELVEPTVPRDGLRYNAPRSGL